MTEQVVDADKADDKDVADALFGEDESTDTAEDNESVQDETDNEQDDEGQEPTKVEDLPDFAQELIRKLRREAAQARVKAKAKETKTEPADGDVAQAEERGRKAARLEFGIELADAKVRSALTGVVAEDKMDDVVDDLNLSRLVDENGAVDDDAVAALKSRYTALLGTNTRKARPNTAASGGTPKKKTTGDMFSEALSGIL